MTWLRLVENLNRIRDPDCIGGWLAVTCSRESMRVARIAGLVPPLDVSGDSRGALRDDTTEDPVDAVVRHEEWRLLRESVEALPDRQRRLVTELLNGCRHKDGWAGAAKRLQMPIGSVGPTRQLAITRLRRDRRLRHLR